MAGEDWGSIDWLADSRTMTGLGLSLSRTTDNPGKTNPAYVHPNCNEAIHVLSGKVAQHLGDI